MENKSITEENYKLVEVDDDSCDQCCFADEENCPEWAHAKCDSAQNHVWKVDTSGHVNDMKENEKKEDDLGPAAQVILGCFGCAVSLIFLALSIVGTAWLAAWICHKYFM